jgi:hypothetical protein
MQVPDFRHDFAAAAARALTLGERGGESGERSGEERHVVEGALAECFGDAACLRSILAEHDDAGDEIITRQRRKLDAFRGDTVRRNAVRSGDGLLGELIWAARIE